MFRIESKVTHTAARLAVVLIIAAGVLLTTCSVAHAASPRLTKTQVRAYLTEAAAHYHLSDSNTRWIVKHGLIIAWHESRYHTRTGHKRGCYGLFQFNASWKHHGGFAGHHHADWRGCGRCSTYRFVKVLKVGGRAAVRRHWRATFR